MASSHPPSPALALLYRFRWPAAVLALVCVFGAMGGGWSNVERFSAQVAALGDTPPKDPKPQLFDPRSDIWFDQEDEALGAYTVLERRFIPEDYIFIGFREDTDPHGAFGQQALETTARLTAALEKIPFVRNVRSITQNPWIRWGEVAEDEDGLIVGDMFAEAPSTYSETQRLERMIAVLGAARASELVGEDTVRKVLGPEARFEDYLGEPRLLRGILSEDGRSTAIQVQVLRPPVTEDRLDEVFGANAQEQREVGPVIYKSSAHSEVVTAIDELVAAETHYDLRVTGVPVVEKHFQDVGQGDMAYVGLMFVVIAIVLVIVYRRPAGVLLPLLVVFTTVIGMNGTVWLAGDLLNNLTAMAPTMMTGVAIADAIHLVTAYYLLRPSHTDKRALIIDVLQRNALPVFLTSITTAVGFLSLTTSAIDPVNKLGYTAGIGAMLAYLLSMTLVPAVLSLLPVRGPAEGRTARAPLEESDAWSDGIIDFVTTHRRNMLFATGVLFAIAFVGLSRMQFSTDMRLMFKAPDQVAADVTWFSDRIGGVGDLELLFYSAEGSADDAASSARQQRIADLQVKRLNPSDATPLSATEQEELDGLLAEEADQQRLRIASSAAFLGKLERFQDRLIEESEKPGSPVRFISRVDSGLDVLRKMHQVQNENQAAFYRVPTEADVPEAARRPRVTYDEILEEANYVPAQSADSLVAQYYLQYENGAKPSENLASLITPDRRGFRMTVRFNHGPSAELLDGFARVREIAAEEFPEIAGTPAAVEDGSALSTMTVTGKQYMFTNMFQRFSDTMVTSLAIALGCITLLIALVFRSPLLGLLSLVPNVLPIILPLSAFGLFGWEIDGPSVVVASVALGVCVDDTIHLFTKFTRAQAEGFGAKEALRRAMRQVGSALTWTTIVLVIGFSMLTLGTFRPNVVTGYLGAIMIALAWLADFILTPALLSYLGDSEPATVAPPAAQAEGRA